MLRFVYDMGAKSRSGFDILGMINDGRILCSHNSASIPSQVIGVGQKEKGPKGKKRTKSVIEKTSQNKFAKAKAPKDTTSRCQPTLSINQHLMNQRGQHLQVTCLKINLYFVHKLFTFYCIQLQIIYSYIISLRDATTNDRACIVCTDAYRFQ